MRGLMRNHLAEILAAIAIIIALLLPLHQKIANGFWFRWDDVWHHEAVEVCFLAFGVGLLLGKYLDKLLG